jgi:hypothetical protein
MTEVNSYKAGDGNWILVFSCGPGDVTHSGLETVEALIEVFDKYEGKNDGWIELPDALKHFKHQGQTEVTNSTNDSIIFRDPNRPQIEELKIAAPEMPACVNRESQRQVQQVIAVSTKILPANSAEAALPN